MVDVSKGIKKIQSLVRKVESLIVSCEKQENFSLKVDDVELASIFAGVRDDLSPIVRAIVSSANIYSKNNNETNI